MTAGVRAAAFAARRAEEHLAP
ncbi:MAG: hypothetical protein QOD24_1193, partial [Solirubrobacteraceae bacterium]|nr:hypothetical protein [Solirubrobacteraceae bacterium]